MKKLLFPVYGAWCWAVFGTLALGAAVSMAVVPGLHRRRRVAHWTARSIFRLAACKVTVEGLEHLPLGPCVVVANHASYVDGVVMQAALPPRFGFMVKREMASVPVAGFLLQRIGTHFVDRRDPNGGAADARRVQRAATLGESIAAFPEGTFDETPGVGRFLGQWGADVTASRSQVAKTLSDPCPTASRSPRPGICRPRRRRSPARCRTRCRAHARG
jgi:1-acyl-sn-glycerol-3-phosphate acyltransferase